MIRYMLWKARRDPFWVEVKDSVKVLDSWEEWDGPVVDGVLIGPDPEYPFTKWVNRKESPLEVRE